MLCLNINPLFIVCLINLKQRFDNKSKQPRNKDKIFEKHIQCDFIFTVFTPHKKNLFYLQPVNF